MHRQIVNARHTKVYDSLLIARASHANIFNRRLLKSISLRACDAYVISLSLTREERQYDGAFRATVFPVACNYRASLSLFTFAAPACRDSTPSDCSVTHLAPCSIATFAALKLKSLDPKARVYGIYEKWSAPFTVIKAVHGFDERVWVDSIPDNVLEIHLSGGPIVCCLGPKDRVNEAGAAPHATLMPKGTPNHFKAPSSVVFGQIYLSDQLLNRAAEALGWSRPIAGALRDDLQFLSDPEMNARSARYFERGLDADAPASSLEMEALSLMVIERLLVGFHHPPLPARGQLVSEARLPRWKLKRVLTILNDDLTKNPTLAELAAAVDLSPFHFARAFRSDMGIPPHRYLMSQRIERAKMMLVQSCLPVIEIAAAVGYEDPGHFAKVFRQMVGLAPRKFRVQQR
jgi:AraC-like DNA-binding protein